MDSRLIVRRIQTIRCAVLMATAMLAGGCAQVLGIEALSHQPMDAAPQVAPDAASQVIPDAASPVAPDAAPQVILDAAPQVPPDAGPDRYTVHVTATGLLGPVALELRLGNDVELLAVTQDGWFTFKRRLETDAPYAVVLVDPAAPCTLRNQTGVIAGADVDIEFSCTGPSLAGMVVSGIAPTVTLAPGTTEYVVDLPLLQQSVTLTATVATPGDTLTIAGTPVASGSASAPVTLNVGDNPVDILVKNALGWQRAYRMTLRRAPQLAQYAYGKASNTGAEDAFAYSVALSGDTLAVGTWCEDSVATGVGGSQTDNTASNSGAVYVFRRAGTAWQQEAYLKASNTGTGDQFGTSVALSGDTLAVGAWGEDSVATGVGGSQTDNTASNSGAVYVFRRAGTAWQQEAYLKASNTGTSDSFGTSVALSGDTLAVGAVGEDSTATGVNGNQADNSASSSGAVYVFRRAGTAWQQEAYLKASNTGTSDSFGTSVALFGDTLAVGAPGEASAATGVGGNQADNSAPFSGAVYVFRRAGTAWQQEAYLKASNTGASDSFGTSVALSGDTLAVGATREDSTATGVNGNQADNSARESGAVYVFRRSGTTWQQEAYIKASNTGAGENIGDGDFVGTSVALAGDTLAVGALGEASAASGLNGNQADNSAPFSGAVYVFHRTGSDWEQEAYLKASNTDTYDCLGISVALAGDTLAVGAYQEASAATGVGGNQADNSAPFSGAVYIFH
jgi:hypothetical protein